MIYCDCDFAMIRRDQETQKAYCFTCDREVDETPKEVKPDLISEMDKLIEKKGLKITFGLQPSQIEIIENRLKAFDGAIYSRGMWDLIGKLIGWCPFTAALYYFEYLEESKLSNASTEIEYNSWVSKRDMQQAMTEYATECVKASLAKAGNKYHVFPESKVEYILKCEVTDEANIVLL